MLVDGFVLGPVETLALLAIAIGLGCLLGWLSERKWWRADANPNRNYGSGL